MVEPLMSHGLLYRYPCYISGPGTISVVLLSRVRELSDFIKKYFNLCSEDEQRSYRERHEGEQLKTQFAFLGELSL